MSLRNKYRSLIEMAETSDIADLNITESEGFITIEGTAPDAQVKFRLWEEYGRIDPDFISGDLILNIRIPDEQMINYTVRSGDNLSKIGKQFGVNWREIVEANRDAISDSYKIYPGQELTICDSRHGGSTGTEPSLKSKSED